MGLWQLLADGYDANSELARVDAGGLYPLSSTTISNKPSQEYRFVVTITLDAKGNFIHSEKVPTPNQRNSTPVKFFPIPVTQESLNRTKKSFPHP